MSDIHAETEQSDSPSVVTLYNSGEGWQIEGRHARHRCRKCGCETDPGTLFAEQGYFGSNESWPVCPRGGCHSTEVDLIVSYGSRS